MATLTATKTKELPKSKFEFEYKKDYHSDWDIHRNYITTFDPYEAMLIGQVFDQVSNSVDGSKITDSYTATLAIERAARVMGKLPDGNSEAMAKADQGKAAFMDILRQKWIYPNANSQHCFETKLRLWQLYSSVYGYMPMFYDWNVSPTGYIGPDCWLWNPRNLVPQQGRTSISDMDYVTALTWVSKKYLQDIVDDASESNDGDENKSKQGGWNMDAVKELLELAENMSTGVDQEKDTQTERTRIAQATKKGICLATRYEAGEDGEWVTFAPDHSYVEVRRIDNPHKNGRIPFVIKYSQPLYDSFYGLGDFQRAKPLQFARDGLTNFYFKGIKMNLIPPIVVNSNGVVKHTLDYREGAVMMETIPNSIRRLETSNAGLATYQAALSSLTGSLLSLFGSQNASAPASETLNPSQGKTPQAISLYSDKEATRDGQERMYLEEAIEQLTDGFFSLVANVGTETIPVNLFADDIQKINEAGLTDVVGLFTKKFEPNSTLTGGELKIKPDSLKGVEYRFNIATGTTAKENRDSQLQTVETLMTNIGKFQNLFSNDPRIDINWAAMMSSIESLSDIEGANKFITVKDGASPQEEQLQQENQKLKEQMQILQSKAASKDIHPYERINYADAPPMIQGQMEAQAGMQPDPDHLAGQAAPGTKAADIINKQNQTMQQSQPAPSEPTVTSQGHVFHDPMIGQVADKLMTSMPNNQMGGQNGQ